MHHGRDQHVEIEPQEHWDPRWKPPAEIGVEMVITEEKEQMAARVGVTISINGKTINHEITA